MSKSPFPSNLAHLRKKRGLTQQQLADKVGIKRACIGSYEEGRGVPTLEVLCDIADCLRVTVDELIRGDAKAFEPTPVQVSKAEILIRKLIKDLQQIQVS